MEQLRISTFHQEEKARENTQFSSYIGKLFDKKEDFKSRNYLKASWIHVYILIYLQRVS